MAFRSKKTGPVNPTDMDEGSKINQRAAVLQRIAAEGSTGAETLSALANALGNEVAALVMQHPNVRNSSTQHRTKTLDGMLEMINEQVREFAYIKATGSSASTQTDTASENPYRALDPDAFDKGAKINRQANELRCFAAKELTGSDVVVALQTALGNEIAANAIHRNPNFSPDQKLYVIDQLLDGVCPGVREAAYMAADLPSRPQNDEGKDLTSEEFNALTTRIINEATKNNTPVGDALSATAKALGVQISILAERPNASAEELIKFSQNAVADFAQEAIAYVRQKS
jgi:hypothetical protein